MLFVLGVCLCVLELVVFVVNGVIEVEVVVVLKVVIIVIGDELVEVE